MIQAHLRHITAAGLAPATTRDRKRLLLALHEELPFGLAYASTDELEQFIGNPDWSAWTRYTYSNHVRGFYGWADGRWLQGDPSADMRRQRNPGTTPRPVTTGELEIALARAGEPWRTAIVLAAFAGLRVNELANVRREDVTQETIWIQKAKGGDPASVDTHPAIWALAELRPSGRLARKPNGEPITGRWLSERGKVYFQRIGLPGVTMHRFRHWFGTTLLNDGADLRTVQEALRHKSITSTMGYTKVAGGQRRLAIRSLPTPATRPQQEQ